VLVGHSYSSPNAWNPGLMRSDFAKRLECAGLPHEIFQPMALPGPTPLISRGSPALSNDPVLAKARAPTWRETLTLQGPIQASLRHVLPWCYRLCASILPLIPIRISTAHGKEESQRDSAPKPQGCAERTTLGSDPKINSPSPPFRRRGQGKGGSSNTSLCYKLTRRPTGQITPAGQSIPNAI